jgi:hypothetical protein
MSDIQVAIYEELHEQYHEADDSYYIFFITRLKCFNYYN